MKSLATLSLLALSFSTFAMPYRCTSIETKEGAPVVHFKINPPQKRLIEGQWEERYVLGVTPVGMDRFALYPVEGRVTAEEISMNFVERGFLTGYLHAVDHGEGFYEGEFKHSSISNRVLNVKCLDISGTESAPTSGETRTSVTVTDFTVKVKK